MIGIVQVVWVNTECLQIKIRRVPESNVNNLQNEFTQTRTKSHSYLQLLLSLTEQCVGICLKTIHIPMRWGGNHPVLGFAHRDCSETESITTGMMSMVSLLMMIMAMTSLIIWIAFLHPSLFSTITQQAWSPVWYCLNPHCRHVIEP